jgi:hypothetical protein
VFPDISRAVSWGGILTRIFDRYFFLALIVSTVPILVLCNGFAGSVGNSLVTGIFIVCSTSAVALFGEWRRVAPNLCDLAFVAYAGCVAVSFWLNGFSDIKEAQLLALSLACYPACRVFAGDGLKPTFVFVTLSIVALGTLVTAFDLIDQWDHPHGKPLLFGRFEAGSNFLMSLGFAVIALACTEMTTRLRIWAAVLITPAIVIFAASMVRLPFIAILAALSIGAYFSSPARLRQMATVILLVLVAVSAGLLLRSNRTPVFLGYATLALSTLSESVIPAAESTELNASEGNAPVAPSCSMNINHDDSINIRIGLFRDAMSLIKRSGLFGVGLDGFMKQSCISSTQVHNSFLQAGIEFGWLGGISLLAMVCIAGFYLLPLARADPEARFALCSLVCITIATLGAGRTSRDGILFLFLGFAASLHNLRAGSNRANRLGLRRS